MPVVAICGEKGGVGKTTMTVSLGAAFARAGKKTLLIDFDPQASLTRGLLGNAETNALPIDASVLALFGESFVPLESLLVPLRFEQLWLLPGTGALKDFNLPGASGPHLFALRNQDMGDFERVLIDCPPILGLLTGCAMAAADGVLTPTKADPYGAHSIRATNAEIVRIKADVNPALVHLGILFSAHKKRNAIHIAYATKLEREFPSLLFTNSVPDSAVMVEAVEAETPIAFYRPRHAAAKAVALVADEMMERLNRASVPAYREVA